MCLSTASGLIAPSEETGSLGIAHLKDLWWRALQARRGVPQDGAAFHLDRVVMSALGIGLEQTTQYLLQTAPTFDEFERWVVAQAGPPDRQQVARFNAALQGLPPPPATQAMLEAVRALAPVLSADDLAHWNDHGYVVVPQAVPPAQCRAAEAAVWEHVGARAGDAESWYKPSDRGIMQQLFQHPALLDNRQAPRIHKAFAQLWETPDLWVSTDRVGFNVPERPGWPFPGPHLHWDVSLMQPIPFGTQGILYLTDTTAEQGAFTCVPGFHRVIDAWLNGLPAGSDPRSQDLEALGPMPIAGRAGDLIIWDQRLPHGSRPNRAAHPRIVQYINMYPMRVGYTPLWR